MLIQREKVIPPPGALPDFASLAEKAHNEEVPNEWIKVPAKTFVQGIDDPENDDGPDRYFGWDNEKPQRQVSVPTFEAKARPITNAEFASFLQQSHQTRLPAMWTTSVDDGDASVDSFNASTATNAKLYVNGDSQHLTDAYLEGKSVKTMYGAVPLKYALDWPMIASYDELSACAKWMGGRIPSAEEIRSIYNYADVLKTKETERVQTRTISAVNGYGFAIIHKSSLII